MFSRDTFIRHMFSTIHSFHVIIKRYAVIWINTLFYTVSYYGALLCMKCMKYSNRNMSTKRVLVKNCVHSRLSSIRYSVAITLHSLFNTLDESNESFEDNVCNVCFYCNISLESKSRAIDHIFPVIINRKPSNRMVLSKWNQVICCVTCNSKKSNRECIDWMKKNGIDDEKIQRIAFKMSKVGFLSKTNYRKLLAKYEWFFMHHEFQCNILLQI